MQNNYALIKKVISICHKNLFFRLCLSLYFSFSVKILKFFLKQKNYSISLLIKGSYRSKKFTPGFSDIDLMCVYNSDIEKANIKLLIKKINFFFPHINDIDFVKEKDFSILTKYGGLKFSKFQNWYVLSDKLSVKRHLDSYLYIPLKYRIDILEELYFQLEWFFKNQQHYLENKTRYDELNLVRILSKIDDIILEIIPDFKATEKKDLKIEIILQKLNAINWNVYIAEALECKLAKEERHYEFIEEKYVVVGPHKIQLKGRADFNSFDMYIPKNLFDIFHALGFFHLDALANSLLRSEETLTTAILFMRLYIQTEIFSRELTTNCKSEIYHAVELLEKYAPHYRGSMKDLLHNNMFITVTWGECSKRIESLKKTQVELKKQNGENSFFHIHFGDSLEKLEKNFENILFLKIHNENEGLWHKEALYNIAFDLLPFSKNYIFADADIYSENENWLKESFRKIEDNKNVFFQCFSEVKDSQNSSYHFRSWIKNYLNQETRFDAPGLVWGLTKKTFMELNGLPDMVIDGSNDGALIQEISGLKMGQYGDYTWFQKMLRPQKNIKMDYIDIPVIHNNHGEISDYRNRGQVLEILDEKFLESYFKNSLGIVQWSNTEAPLWSLFVKSYGDESFLELYRKLNENKMLKIKDYAKFYCWPYEEVFVECFNSIVQLKGSDKQFEIINPTYTEAHIKLTCGKFDVHNEEIIHLVLKIDGKFNELFSHISVKEHSYELANRSQVDSIVDLSFSHWGEHTSFFPELSFKVPSKEQVKVEVIKIENIHLVHSWVELFKSQVQTNLFSIEDGIKLGAGWYKFELSFDLQESHEIEVLVIRDDGTPLSNLRIYKVKNNTISYAFHKDIWTERFSLQIKGISSEDNNFELGFFRRKEINP